MSFFSSFSLSLSPHRRHYRGGHYGSGHYQRKGLLGNLADAFISRSGRNYYYDGYADPNVNINVNTNPYPNQTGHPYQQQQYQQPYRQQPAGAVCTGCNAVIPAGSKFCLNCGAKVAPPNADAGAANALYCPNCGNGLPPNARFCQKCGVKLNQ